MNPFAELRRRLRNLENTGPDNQAMPGDAGNAEFILRMAEALIPVDDFTGDVGKYCVNKLTEYGGCYALNLLYQRFVR